MKTIEEEIRLYELWQKTREAYGTAELQLIPPVGAS